MAASPVLANATLGKKKQTRRINEKSSYMYVGTQDVGKSLKGISNHAAFVYKALAALFAYLYYFLFFFKYCILLYEDCTTCVENWSSHH